MLLTAPELLRIVPRAMKPINWSIATILAAGLAWSGPIVRAQEPAETGHVLLLKNERTLEGDIVRDGDEYRIRHQDGETTIPADTVLALCGDMRQAYARLHGRSNLNDPDEHLCLAQWCRMHGLHAEAIAELEVTLRLDPDCAQAQRTLRALQKERPETMQVAKTATKTVREPTVEISAQAIAMYTTRIQPILMNTCIPCHSRSDSGNFRLTRVFGNPGIKQPSTRHNLAATLAQIHPSDPLSSPLLVKALSLHGTASRPPLKDRNTPAYRLLEEWVRLQAAAPMTPAPVSTVSTREVLPTAPVPAAVPASATVTENSGTFAQDRKDDATRSMNGNTPADPFDPALFNRMAHPERTRSPSP
jgi:hypothetical protein